MGFSERREIRLTRGDKIPVLVLVGMLIGILSMEMIASAQKASVPKPQDKLRLGDNEVRQLMLLIDTNNHGRSRRKNG